MISEGIEQLDSLSDLATLINDSPPAKALTKPPKSKTRLRASSKRSRETLWPQSTRLLAKRASVSTIRPTRLRKSCRFLGADGV